MNLPKHLAIIMDGNGRWAQQKSKPRVYGHIKGTRVAKKIIQQCAKNGIQFLTLYAFSTENWFRPKAEVSMLMGLLKRYLDREVENLVKENIKFNIIGDVLRLPKDIYQSVNNAILKTENCTGMNLIFALSYGSRQEMVSAAKTIATQVKEGVLNINDIDEACFSQHLSTYPIPDPDLMIRTSGEIRISNFLLWQIAYSELYFTPKLWPDFEESDLMAALKNYSNRNRRFGGLVGQSHHQAGHSAETQAAASIEVKIENSIN